MKWLFGLLMFLSLLAVGTVLSNRPPIFDPPGPLTRLRIYLTTHVAQTQIDHPRAELRPLRLELSEQEAMALVKYAMIRLRWRDIKEDEQGIRALVKTRWLGFLDDVSVTLEPATTGVLVQVRSASRMGRGDFAANTRHVLDLYETLRFLDGQTVVHDSEP
jgi:uncharacterized protein (DUF1499 family)